MFLALLACDVLISVNNIGRDGDAFTVELHYGGFFVGFGHLRSYVDEKVNWFDWIDCDTWSALWFEDFCQKLGYDSVKGFKFYWLLPWKHVSDGLRLIATDADTNEMVGEVQKVTNLVVYVDHADSLNSVDWDDVVCDPVNELPQVFSPQKIIHAKVNHAEKLPVFYTDLSKGKVEQSGPSREPVSEPEYKELDFFDSDYVISDGDDDLFEDEIVPMKKGNKKAKGSV
jgi:hypothetical protein